MPRGALIAGCAAGLCLAGTPAAPALAASAPPAVFNGRIAFASLRTTPPAGAQPSFDLFSANPDGSRVTRLTTNPAADRQPDWSPDGRAVAYSISKPDAPSGFEVARMDASGADARRLTTTPGTEASSQPGWLPDASAIVYRRSGPGLVSSIWQMGPLGESPALRLAPPQSAWYPSLSPATGRMLFAATVSPVGDSDRAIMLAGPGEAAPVTLFDVPGAYDSAPAWSPDGARIAFESNANIAGANPEGDMEIWAIAPDGGGLVQLTRNAAHDEGPAWSPDATLLAYTSGSDEKHGDIHVMTAEGTRTHAITAFAGADESPDWQPIPAPATDRRCGDVARRGPGTYDVRRAGRGIRCGQALALVARWKRAGRPARVGGWVVSVADFGGTLRVVMQRGAGVRSKLVAFLQRR